MAKDAGLIHLISDLTEPTPYGVAIRKRFNEHPYEVMECYELDADGRQAVCLMDKYLIIEAIEKASCTWDFVKGDLAFTPDSGCLNYDPSCSKPHDPNVTGLLHLVSDLLLPGCGALRLQPVDKVAMDYKLSKAEKAALSKKDVHGMVCLIDQELEDWEFPEDEFPAEDCDPSCKRKGCSGNNDDAEAQYPDPEPGVYKVTLTGTAKGTADFEVVGQGFIEDRTRFRLCIPPCTGTVNWQPGVVDPKGTYRCSHMAVAGYTLPAAGVYRVQVAINVADPGAAAEVLVPLPCRINFTVT